MIRISLGALAALAFAAMVGAVALLTPTGVVEAQSHSASRAFQRTWEAPGSELRVTITASNYGAFGQVVETLPEGFSFVSASLPVAEEGQVVRFNLFGDTSFTYVVTVPTAEGQYVFSGTIRNQDKEERTISGHRQFRVGPPPTPAPTSTPTPTPTATATPEPTATPTPEPTATPVPTATPTPSPSPTPAPTATSTPVPTPTAEPTADRGAYGHAVAGAHRHTLADGDRCDGGGNAGSGIGGVGLSVVAAGYVGCRRHPWRLVLSA